MHSIFYFIFTPFFPTKEIIFLFHLGNIFCRTVYKNIGAGIDTLMSNSDGLGPSIFCRKMEKARPMREEMDGKVVYFPPESALLPLIILFDSTCPYLYLDLACKQLCFPPGKGMNRRNESTTSEFFRAV